MSDVADVTATCPHCGSEDICGYDHIMASAGIQGWMRTSDGELIPDWAGSTDVHWDTQQPNDDNRPYQCQDCGELLSAKELVVVEQNEEEAA